jgi:hypothetical protein
LRQTTSSHTSSQSCHCETPKASGSQPEGSAIGQSQLIESEIFRAKLRVIAADAEGLIKPCYSHTPLRRDVVTAFRE